MEAPSIVYVTQEKWDSVSYGPHSTLHTGLVKYHQWGPDSPKHFLGVPPKEN